MAGSWSPFEFPGIDSKNTEITSPTTVRYNCIAWAAGNDSKWWWPAHHGYWPPNIPRDETVDAFVRAYATLGFRECEDGALEAGVEKLVLYAKTNSAGDLEPTHAARQLADGKWSSKLGPLEDVSHNTPEVLNGPCYGAPIKFFSRPRNP